VRAGVRGSVRVALTIAFVLLLSLAAAACGTADPSVLRATTTQSPSTTDPGPVKAIQTSAGQDQQFFTDVTEADSSLENYVEKQGNIALRALLTDGSAFCSLLEHGGGVDSALVGVAEGARNEESQTHLPLSVTTFNSIESVALLTLCPSELKLLPKSEQVKVLSLAAALAGH
jgi:hypothetical protein